MRFKKVEAAMFGPKSYVEAAERSNAWAIACSLRTDMTAGYHSVIITKKGSGLKTIEDLKGKTYAFNDPNSTSGYLVPMTYFLNELGIVPENHFSNVSFSGSHEASVMTVKAGRVDAASTNDVNLVRKMEEGMITEDDFNIVWESDLIPESPIAVRGDLPYELVMRIQRAIISFKDPEALKNLQSGGFVAAKDSDYDPIRAMKKLKEELRKGQGR
jgi:phosphonate transport system substrate-binding protein